MSASGVVSIAFAKTGFALLCTIPSEMFPPSQNELIEMLKDYLPHLALQTRRAVVFKVLDDVEAVRLQPSISVEQRETGLAVFIESQQVGAGGQGYQLQR